MDILAGKRITVMVTGGIAAYKAADIVSELVKRQAVVTVAMSANACRFISPLTMKTLSNNKVFVELFDDDESAVGHVWLADNSDLIVIVPATANIIGKIAGGIADDLLTSTLLAAVSPVLICPAMNVHMYENSIVQENINKLRQYGYLFVEPGYGRLACGYNGRGRLADKETIIYHIEKCFIVQDLKEIKLVVTAGPTREQIDPVRFLSNYSSGKMGYAIADAAARRGAEVYLIHGPTDLKPPTEVVDIPVVSAAEMAGAISAVFNRSDAVVMSAAVADFRPAVRYDHKIKKSQTASGSNEAITELKLVKNPDILQSMGNSKNKQILVGFAAETRDLFDNAKEKLIRKNLDFIVANDITEADSGFNSDNNLAHLIFPSGEIKSLPKIKKTELADIILDEIKALLS